jgi:hypothetical protein
MNPADLQTLGSAQALNDLNRVLQLLEEGSTGSVDPAQFRNSVRIENNRQLTLQTVAQLISSVLTTIVICVQIWASK